jgi:isopenicillin N synthase-like dioxygenase
LCITVSSIALNAYYFPGIQIGWHNDSGFLTALAGDLYLDSSSGTPSLCPDPAAGLYVVTRGDQVQKVVIPPDCLAIQVGECTQIVTHGALQATPHCVRGAPGLARASLACFVDVPPQFPLVGDASIVANSSDRVPPLVDRWHSGMTFGDFLSTTFQKYYEWNTKR